MNNVNFYRSSNNSLSVLILGIPVSESNHHVYSEKLVQDLNNEKNNLGITYIKILKQEDIDYSKIQSLREKGVVVSSDIILDKNYFDVVIFVDTPEKILQARGLKVVVDNDAWNYFKKSYRINKFVNDNSYKKIFSVNKVIDNQTYDKLWTTFNEVINKFLS